MRPFQSTLSWKLLSTNKIKKKLFEKNLLCLLLTLCTILAHISIYLFVGTNIIVYPIYPHQCAAP